MRLSRCLAAASAGLLYADIVAAVAPKAVFAHYMVGTVFEDHVKQDVDDAAAMGLDGFALNIGDPTGAETRTLLGNIMDYAASSHSDFKFFISMDLFSPKNLSDFDQILTDFLGHEAYYKGSDGYPFVSTYGSGEFDENVWSDWRDKWADKIYFVPDFADAMALEGSDGWWDKWGVLIAGLFSWESTWPARGEAATFQAVEVDKKPEWTKQRNKAYMIGLSMLQYKNSYGANIYRAGEENLPLRMSNILDMDDRPDFTQILTWNDGPESHYIGNIWPEQDNTTEMRRYANEDAPHKAIQPILSSFITAFKSGASSREMAPPGNARAAGSLWFKPILANTSCPQDNDLHSDKPDGYEVAVDVSSWAVVVSDNGGNMTLHGFSDGEEIGSADLVAGLNFGNFSAMGEGTQCMEVRSEHGGLVAVAKGGRNVTSDCPDGIYNLNPQILQLVSDDSVGGCASSKSSSSDDDDDDDSGSVLAVMLDRYVFWTALLASLASVTGVLGL